MESFKMNGFTKAVRISQVHRSMIQFSSHSGIHTLKVVQDLKYKPITEAWAFFSNPRNLSKITPKTNGVQHNLRRHQEYVFEGQIISYKVSPLLRHQN